MYILNLDIVEEDNDHFCLADLTQLFSKWILPEGKTSKTKENKTSVRNAEGRLITGIHASSTFTCGSNPDMRWLSQEWLLSYILEVKN